METSIVHLVITETLKQKCKNIQTTMLPRLQNNSIHTSSAIQRDLRAHFNRSFPELRLHEKGPSSLPIYFALAIIVSSNIDKITTIDNLMKPIFRLQSQTGDLELQEPEWFCVCSHCVTYLHLFCICNKDTGAKLYVGCDCIKKNKLISPEEMRIMNTLKRERHLDATQTPEQIRERKDKKEKRLRKKALSVIKKHLQSQLKKWIVSIRLDTIKRNQEREQLRQLAIAKKETFRVKTRTLSSCMHILTKPLSNRRCIGCCRFNIDKTKPSWSVRCYDCWKKWKSNSSPK